MSPPSGHRGGLPACVLLLSAGAGCAPVRGQAFEVAFAEASRDEGAGRFAEAAAAYNRAAAAARRQRDRDQAKWDAAVLVARTGPLADALARLDDIASDAREHAAEAALRAAELRIEQGDAATGWERMRQVAVQFPQHGVAHIAVRRLVEHARESGGEQGALDELHALDVVAGSTEVGPLIAFLTAESIEARGDDAGALAAYLRIADRWPYPFGAFWDDSLWRASLLHEKLGQPRAAVDDLERMVKERETTNIVGTYERPKYVPAMLRIGALWQGPLHDPGKARDAYHRLYSQFANSTSRDDALWLEASSWKDEGRADRACGLLSTLVHEFPDSRYVPCAVESCSSLARPDKSKAPRECHPYIKRESEQPAGEAREGPRSGTGS